LDYPKNKALEEQLVPVGSNCEAWAAITKFSWAGKLMATGIENRQAVFSWLSIFLRDFNLQFSRSGFKNGDDLGKHTIDEDTGNWGDVAYSSNKPARWLFQIDLNADPILAKLPDDVQEGGIGGSNTAQGDKAGIAVRILPLLQTAPEKFVRADGFEVNALFLFHGALAAGSSSDAFTYNLAIGTLLRSVAKQREAVPYIFAALIGLRPREDTMQVKIDNDDHDIAYGAVIDALRQAIMVRPKGQVEAPIELYDLSDDAEAGRLTVAIEKAWQAAGPQPQPAAAIDAGGDDEAAGEIDIAALEIPEHPDLLGIDKSVYRQINAMLRSGKQHIMLYGPPGTGKTSLARWIAGSLPGGQWTLVTGSSDWSSQDIIGGYQPIGNGDVDFVPGILLREFDKPLIIDELNRCDIDKVIGPLFTVLSGQQTTLPYRTDITDKHSPPYAILPRPKPNAAEHEFAPGTAWRLIATINSIDKASLYQMSYALARRFGWVYVDAPQNLAVFIAEYLQSIGEPVGAVGDAVPLAELWRAINNARVIGPAPIIDAINAIRELAPGSSFFGAADAPMQLAAVDAIDMVLLPMLDGVVFQDATNIADAAIAAFGLAGVEADRVKRRLETVAI
jgi:5-methylcytosine-specific restriction protein B